MSRPSRTPIPRIRVPDAESAVTGVVQQVEPAGRELAEYLEPGRRLRGRRVPRGVEQTDHVETELLQHVRDHFGFAAAPSNAMPVFGSPGSPMTRRAGVDPRCRTRGPGADCRRPGSCRATWTANPSGVVDPRTFRSPLSISQSMLPWCGRPRTRVSAHCGTTHGSLRGTTIWLMNEASEERSWVRGFTSSRLRPLPYESGAQRQSRRSRRGALWVIEF